MQIVPSLYCKADANVSRTCALQLNIYLTKVLLNYLLCSFCHGRRIKMWGQSLSDFISSGIVTTTQHNSFGSKKLTLSLFCANERVLLRKIKKAAHKA